MKNKRGQVLSSLGALGIGVATLVIIMSVMFLVTSQVSDQIIQVEGIPGQVAGVNGSAALNATQDLTIAAATIPGWVPLIILVAIGGLILGLVATFGQR